jgi:polyphosphate kinase 2 (PPK2 family)
MSETIDKEKLFRHLIVPADKTISLHQDYDPAYKADYLVKEDANELLQHTIDRMAELQDKLYAQDNYGVLILFQALDAAGKDGTIKHVMSGINPQGCDVTSSNRAYCWGASHFCKK